MQIDKLIQQLTNSNDEMEFMPIIPLGESDVENLDPSTLPETLPIIALRNTVLFPNVVLPITVAREKSLEAIKIIGKEKWIGVVAQKDTNEENPTAEGLHYIGTLAKV